MGRQWMIIFVSLKGVVAFAFPQHKSNVFWMPRCRNRDLKKYRLQASDSVPAFVGVPNDRYLSSTFLRSPMP